MGQIESRTAAAAARKPESRGGHSSSSSSSSSDEETYFDSLMAEIAAFGFGDENESVGAKAQKALDCPCIAHLRTGPCGTRFSDAFLCFLKSTSEEKGSDCVNPFVALQACIGENPKAFVKDVLDKEEEVKEEEKPAEEYKMSPPLWSVQST